MITINEQYFTKILASRLSRKSSLSESIIFTMAQEALKDALGISTGVCELYEHLKERIVHFAYVKKDATTREAWGTLDPIILQNYEKARGTGSLSKSNRHSPANYVTYFDVEKNAFRSFAMENFLYMY